MQCALFGFWEDLWYRSQGLGEPSKHTFSPAILQ